MGAATVVTGVALVDDYARRCALNGCGVTIQNVPGRPERRYCTATHRAAARQVRRAAMQPEQRARLVETLPWVAEPEKAPSPPPARTPGAPSAAGPPLRGRVPRHRGTIALLGAVGVLAGGYSITSSESARQAAPPTQEAPGGGTADAWAARAEVTLLSVDRQLDTIASTEAAWNAASTPEAGPTPPTPVAALRDRKALLERRKVALRSQLDSYRALDRTRADLDLSEQHLDAVESALTDTSSSAGPASPDDAAALAVLEEQRDLRVRQRDAKRAELAGLQGTIERAARTPLPDDGQETAAVSDLVLEVIHTGGQGHRPPTDRPARPEVVAGGHEGEQADERPATTTSAPKDPRGPRDGSAERRAESERRAARARAAKPGPAPKIVEQSGGMRDGGHSATNEARDPTPSANADTGSRHKDKPSGATEQKTGAAEKSTKDAADSRKHRSGASGEQRRVPEKASSSARKEDREGDVTTPYAVVVITVTTGGKPSAKSGKDGDRSASPLAGVGSRNHGGAPMTTNSVSGRTPTPRMYRVLGPGGGAGNAAPDAPPARASGSGRVDSHGERSDRFVADPSGSDHYGSDQAGWGGLPIGQPSRTAAASRAATGGGLYSRESAGSAASGDSGSAASGSVRPRPRGPGSGKSGRKPSGTASPGSNESASGDAGTGKSGREKSGRRKAAKQMSDSATSDVDPDRSEPGRSASGHSWRR